MLSPRPSTFSCDHINRHLHYESLSPWCISQSLSQLSSSRRPKHINRMERHPFESIVISPFGCQDWENFDWDDDDSDDDSDEEKGHHGTLATLTEAHVQLIGLLGSQNGAKNLECWNWHRLSDMHWYLIPFCVSRLPQLSLEMSFRHDFVGHRCPNRCAHRWCTLKTGGFLPK